MKKITIYLGFVLIAILYGCRTDEIIQQEETKLFLLTEARKVAEKEQLNFNVLKVTQKMDWDNAIISEGEDYNVVEVPLILKENIAVSDNKTIYKPNHRLLFRKLNDNTWDYYYLYIDAEKPVKEISKINYKNVDDDFKGRIVIFNNNNEIVEKLKFKINTSVLREDAMVCTWIGWWYDDGHFEPIALLGCTGGGSGVGSGYGIRTGGGSGNGNSQTTDPCAKLKEQNTNQSYNDKITELNKSAVLSKKTETGYKESKSGNFTSLTPSTSTSSSDGLKLTIDSETKGYLHTHVNDYEDGTYDENGNPRERQPIRMFSPADVNALMEMASYANGNYGDLYGTMVSSDGNYTIKFTGTAADIKTGFDTKQWRDDFKSYKIQNKNWSNEKLFLKFLSEKMNVKGISLYKIKSNGTVQNKTLDANNIIQSNDCPK